MNAEDYKHQTTSPDAFSRGVLTDTLAALSSEFPFRHHVEAVLESPPIPKPPLHSAEPHTDYFRVSLSANTAEAITDALFTAEAGAVAADGSTTPQASHYAALVDTWTRYTAFLHDNQVAE